MDSLLSASTLNQLVPIVLVGTSAKQVCIALLFTWTAYLMSRCVNQQQKRNK